MSAAPPRRGVQIARVAGVPVVLMPSWFLFAGYLVLIGQSAMRDRVGQSQALALAGAFVLVLLASVVLHELGHCLVARAFDLPVRSITITLLAGLTEITEAPQTPAREYAVAVSGPMVSLLLCAAGVAGAAQFPTDSTTGLLCAGLAVTNGVIAVLNLLPGLPLDGGRVLRSVVWQLGGDPDRATRVAARAGIGLAFVVIPVLVVGVLPAYGIGTRGPTTILISALVGAFIYLQAAGALRRGKVMERVPELSVETLARPALPVPASMPLAEAVRRANDALLRALVVVDGRGEAEGIVSESWVKSVPLERRPWVSVVEGARRLEPGLLLDPALRGEALLTAMQQEPATEYLVRGNPLRVLVSTDVARAIEA